MRYLLPLIAMLALLSAAAPISRAEDFRVETDVLVEEREEPIARTLTLFADGYVYDFLLIGAREVTFFDPQGGRFVLLDRQRQVKTTLSVDDVLRYTTEMKAHAKQDDSIFHFAAYPDFEVSEQEGAISLTGRRITYRVEGVRPEEEGVARQYQNFADWFARLNALRGGLPPFARMELNRQLARRGLAPRELEFTATSPQRFRNRSTKAVSRHHYNWILSNKDRERIEEVGNDLARFQAVSFEEYRRESDVASKEKTQR